VPQIAHSELTQLTLIRQGDFGVYRAYHPKFHTIIYKELVQMLADRYAKVVILQHMCIFENIVLNLSHSIERFLYNI